MAYINTGNLFIITTKKKNYIFSSFFITIMQYVNEYKIYNKCIKLYVYIVILKV